MEPWQSWALALGLGGAAALYYTQGNGKVKAAARRASVIADNAEAAATSKRKQPKQKPATPGKSILVDSATSKARQDKADRGGSSHQRGPSVTFGADADNEADQAQEDKDWARQLEANKKGVSITASGQQSAKSKKQNKKNKQAPEQPGPAPAQAAAAASANDVSDMLEPTPAGPSVIRITGEEKPKNPKTAAAAPQQETKKQRQNRKKAEEKKLQREQDEQERQALLEKQRRTARESRGEPARNGVSVAPAPANGAWAAHSVANGGSAPAAASTVPLLDTFEPNTASSPSATNVQTSSSAPVAVGSTIAQDIPSEEVQMEMLNELNGWAEVPSKAKKGKKATPLEPAASAPATAAAAATAASTPTPAKKENKFANVSTSELVGGKKNGKKSANINGYAALEAATDFTPVAKGHPQDSDWAAN